jgi:AraC-like DNA-binding protein
MHKPIEGPFKEQAFQDPNECLQSPFVTLAHVFHAPEGWKIVGRKLKQYALQYVVHGIAEYEIEGTVYVTKTGDMIIHRPDELHSIRTVSGQPYVCISLVFHFGESAFPLEPLLVEHSCGNYAQSPVEHMLSELVVQYKHPDISHRLKCQGLFLTILAEVGMFLSVNKGQSAHRKNMNKLIVIKNDIIKHFNQQLDYSRLEQLSGMTKNYMITQFKQEFGMSPGQFQIWLRIQKAQELAIQKGLSIGEIALEVGYSDVHTFGKMFKKKTGHSLSQFCSSLCR